MTVVFASGSGAMGGAEISLLTVMTSVREANPAWTLLLLAGENGPLEREASRRKFPSNVLALPPRLAELGDSSVKGSGKVGAKLRLFGSLIQTAAATLAYCWRLRTMLAAQNPDLIHANGFKMQLLCAVAKPGRSRLIWHIHDYVASRPVIRMLLAVASRRCDGVIANSDSVAADVRTVTRGRVCVTRVYNAVDCSELAPNGPSADLDVLVGKPSPAAGVVRVGLIATFAKWKGHEVFLRAIAMLDQSLPFRAYVIGGAVYQTRGSQYSLKELKAASSQLGLTERVGFTGFVRNRAEAFRSLDVVVHASTEPEPFGMVIIEAMSCGRALIAASGGGAGELTMHEVDSLVHRRGDAEDLAAQIERLIRDQALRTRLSIQGREKALAHFSAAGLAAQLQPIYRGVLS